MHEKDHVYAYARVRTPFAGTGGKAGEVSQEVQRTMPGKAPVVALHVRLKGAP